MNFDMEALIDWQQLGMNARVLGLSKGDNPVAARIANASCLLEKHSWLQKAEAWIFGWNIENAARAFSEKASMAASP
ncbi:hypothetical protein J2T09_005533 [Neorhizobium huautlense]|uniref:Uncharacterized protein n=1 Tax=Neorhizobium huautlense TaxID=67774 RepID=A0ABT9Q1Z0_9HYPH|nr:CrpP-related protein [Neorhizobium huautlense]MDP9840745.1 hypothetical protein [Neorhizobium huautlense]